MALFMCFMIAISLSMDTFSLSIIYGTLGMNKKEILKLSILVGIFHFFMPLLGDLVGEVILNYLPIEASTFAGIIFFVIAFQMIVSLFKNEEVKKLTTLSSLLLFAFTVSIDSFSVGIGLSAIHINHIFATTIFMCISFIFTFLGLYMGKKLKNYFGKIATLLGSIILLILSIYYIFIL